MVFPTCKKMSSSGVGSDCKINVAFNQQLPLCKTSTQKNCRSPEKLCTADNSFKFDLDPSPNNKGFLSIDLAHLTGSSGNLLLRDDTFSPPIPVPLRIGDMNLDGFPDILAIVAQKDGSHVPKVLLSKSGTTFELVRDNVEALDAIKDARAIAVVDLDEDVSGIVVLDHSSSDAPVGLSRCIGAANGDNFCYIRAEQLLLRRVLPPCHRYDLLVVTTEQYLPCRSPERRMWWLV